MPQPAPPRPQLKAGMLWAGGLATAVVAALVVVVGVMIARGVLEVPVLAPEGDGYYGNVTTTTYSVCAALCALAATGLMHLLLVAMPRPIQFFSWITGLATVAAAVAPLTIHVEWESKAAASVINLVTGICIMTLIASVAASSIRPATHQQPPPYGWE